MIFVSPQAARKCLRTILHIDRVRFICAVYLFFFGLLAITASATTPTEEALFKAPMPHEVLDREGPAVKVHRVHLHGYLEGKPNNATRLSELKQQVQSCIEDHRRSGHPSTPPGAWPDFLLDLREDTYSSVNRSIHYSRGVTYTINFKDCSLLEQVASHAELASSKGICKMDLIHRTASGVCDASAHADAIVPPRRSVQDAAAIRAEIQTMAADPRTAALAAAMRNMQGLGDTRTGERRAILGLECDVWKQYPATEGSTMCWAHGGSFTAARTAQNPADAGLLLEVQSEYGVKMTAVDARLDTEVNAGVFAPYLNGDFTIKRTGPRK